MSAKRRQKGKATESPGPSQEFTDEIEEDDRQEAGEETTSPTLGDLAKGHSELAGQVSDLWYAPQPRWVQKRQLACFWFFLGNNSAAPSCAPIHPACAPIFGAPNLSIWDLFFDGIRRVRNG